MMKRLERLRSDEAGATVVEFALAAPVLGLRLGQPDDGNRPESATQRVAYDRIAGARILYGGRGQLTSAQQPRYGQQAVDRYFPY